MSPEAVTSERVYAGLRRAVIRGSFAPGTILIVQGIAEAFGTSISPVRDSMQRLVGERLLEPHHGGGFRMPQVTEEGLRHLYIWHGQLIGLALKFRPSGTIPTDFRPSFRTVDPDDRHALAVLTADIFAHIATLSANAEHAVAVRSAGDRLNAIRIYETSITNRLEELEAVWHLAVGGRIRDAQEVIRTYHRRRLRHVSQLARTVNASEDQYPTDFE